VSYRVIWRQRVKRRLDVLTFLTGERGGSPDRITRATEEIDRRLAADPANEGESRQENERVLVVHPLCVTFEVFETSQVVLIYGAILYPRQRA
jgi:hypothetical protein